MIIMVIKTIQVVVVMGREGEKRWGKMREKKGGWVNLITII